MRVLVWTLATLASHWRRKPGQFAAVISGLCVATALWSGVQALNAQARDSYDRAASVLGGDRFETLVAADGGDLAIADYVALRRAGWRVSPVLEGSLRRGGRSYRLLGIDPLTLPPATLGAGRVQEAAALGAFLRPPWRIIATPETLTMLGGTDLPEGLADPDLPGRMIIADIGLAEVLLDKPGAISRLIVAPIQKAGIPPVAEIVAGVERRAPEPASDLQSLTDSFHLNLTAFGLLSFVVGLFIVHATIGLAFEQRRATIRTMRATGVSRRALTAAMLIETVALAVLGGALGMVLGYVLAGFLLPDVAASLAGLYGAAVPGQLNLSPWWWALGLAMTLAGAGVATAGAIWKLRRMPILAPAQAEAWYGAQIRSLKLHAALAGGLAISGLGLWIWGQGLIAGFALMACVLLAAALLLPVVLAAVLSALRRRVAGPLAGWFVAETRAQLGGLSLALMALLLALAINVGVGTMVSSFRAAFLGWLDQRLAADVYLRGTDEAQAAAIADFLGAQPEVRALLPIWNADIRYDGYPVELFGVRDDAMYRESWPLLSALPGTWDRIAGGDAVLLSEQFARRFDLAAGGRVALPAPSGVWELEIAGIYADYGNPVGQAIVSVDGLLTHWPEVEKLRYGVRLAPGTAEAVLARLREAFALQPDQAVDQVALKAFSRRVFEATFAVTLALNVLTFVVAGLALLTSLLTLAEMRLPQLAPAWAMGITRAGLARLELARALLLALLTAVLAVPLGLAVAWLLLAVINVEAFGWRIPMLQFPSQWAGLVVLALVTAVLATLLPVWRLRRTPAALLLRVFSDER